MVAQLAVFTDFGGTGGTPGTQENTTRTEQQMTDGVPNLRFKLAEDNETNLNGRIRIPTSGHVLSWPKWVYIRVTGGTFTQIDNIQFFSDGSADVAGTSILVADETPVRSEYEPPSGSATTGNTLESIGAVSGSAAARTFTADSPKTVTISETGGILNTTGESSDYVILQMLVQNSAQAGDLDSKTYTFQYDEI